MAISYVTFSWLRGEPFEYDPSDGLAYHEGLFGLPMSFGKAIQLLALMVYTTTTIRSRLSIVFSVNLSVLGSNVF
ncbi:MAG: hypothetical protein H6543_00050 [Prevotellaceae bacterium]|nr:hypothetical protein [Prevotellaceae bacterium]